MRTGIIGIAFAAALLIAGAIAVGVHSSATAGNTGCPSGHAATGAAHADPRSAHGDEKQAARDCYVASPSPVPSVTPTPSPTPTTTPTATPSPTPTPTATATPSPTPTPTPTATPSPTPTPTATSTPTPTSTPTSTPSDGADVIVEGVSVSAENTALPGDSFEVSVRASLRNLGPANAVLVDTTFTFSAPGCSAVPSAPFIAQDTNLPENVGVSIGRIWLVTCTEAGNYTFTADVSVVIDASQAISDPDTSNNDGSGNDSTIVG